MNLCDPFHILFEDKCGQNFNTKYKEGFCQNKQELAYTSVSGIRTSRNFKLVFYSFIGENLEFNLFSRNDVDFNAFSSDIDFNANLSAQYVDVFNVVYRF